MTITEVGGYKLTQRAQTEAMMRGLGTKAVQGIFRETVAEWPTANGLWFITDGHNTAIISPYDSVVTSVICGSQKSPKR
ncbi:hypothetical protein [Mycolicibacterium phocaicum]|uniref:hypothetical protein n=1 Tax=Mycolicibacterium phocaicum TaxID=319706 RepID=UPI001CF9AC15|nr:hypothetical protein [Mycolicibacterium phocaicum]UCZ58663.1 hypothetical protein LHJ73_17970 [Mycolicibacterium phocaicum]